MPVRLSRYSDSRIHGMYSKHSALGSRMLGIIQNNDVTSSSSRGLFQNNKQNGYRRRPGQFPNSLQVVQMCPPKGENGCETLTNYNLVLPFPHNLRCERVFVAPITDLTGYCLVIGIKQGQKLFYDIFLLLHRFIFKKFFNKRRNTSKNDVQCCRHVVVLYHGHYSRNGIIVLLTYGRNGYSGIIRNIFLFRNRVNRTYNITIQI